MVAPTSEDGVTPGSAEPLADTTPAAAVRVEPSVSIQPNWALAACWQETVPEVVIGPPVSPVPVPTLVTEPEEPEENWTKVAGSVPTMVIVVCRVQEELMLSEPAVTKV